jgi:hypothetical protein
MGYCLEGSLLEVCNCNVLCPCWVGEDPDNGICEAAIAYNFETGQIDGIDVSGLTVAFTTFIPGNALEGNWKVCLFVDDSANEQQERVLLSAIKGEMGGPLADMAQLVGEIVAEKRAPIIFQVIEGHGMLKIGETVEASVEPFRGPSGKATHLVESAFSPIPGWPAFLSKADFFKMDSPELGLKLDLKGNNAIQGYFRFEC